MDNWILVVDDETANLRTAGQILSGEKMRVSSLKSGEDAIKFLQEHKPDLILLDMDMPGTDGFETIAALKGNKATAALPVVFFITDNDSGAKTRGLEAGAIDFIKKPFVQEEFLRCIRHALEPVRSQSSLSGVRVLVVDDEEINLMVAEKNFKDYQMEVKTAESGREAVELCKKEEFDLIFLDHMMPEMDGIETFHEIKKLTGFPNTDTPVIALTANAAAGAKEFYLGKGFADFLTKPIDGALLEQTVLNCLRKDFREKEKTAGDANRGSEDEIKTDNSHYLKYGITIESGLSLARNSMELYLDLIDMFLKDDKRQDTMRQFIAEQNMKDYAVFVHGLKGNARMLGADKLADTAYEHEMKSKAGDIEYVKAHWDELIAVWNNTRDGFREFYGGYREIDEDKYGMVNDNSGGVLKLSQSDLAEAVALLEDFETDKAIEKLKTWLGNPLEQSMHKRIKDALIALEDEFDEDKAMELLKD